MSNINEQNNQTEEKVNEPIIEPRVKSNMLNIIMGTVGILLLIVAIYDYINPYLEQYQGVSITLILLSILLIAYGWSNFAQIKKENKILECPDYAFDYLKELESFSIIGLDSYNQEKQKKGKTAKKTGIGNWVWSNCIPIPYFHLTTMGKTCGI